MGTCDTSYTQLLGLQLRFFGSRKAMMPRPISAHSQISPAFQRGEFEHGSLGKATEIRIEVIVTDT